MITRSLTHTISIALITLCAQSAFSETLTSQESDRIVKEDIAATQVLAEVCPALIGNNPAFQTKIGSLTQTLKNPFLTSFALFSLRKFQINLQHRYTFSIFFTVFTFNLCRFSN